ncbi:hypothetical protein [Burkholderia contaminans]|uniref:hypothetical protein n=1 Tax=Burkholderia contaminans TaxID=488447 RepID=UPI00158BE981|nr:hypothetical protein [Burkholderia contaminans]
MSLGLKQEIIKVVIQNLPHIHRANYMANQDNTQDGYVKTACDHLGIDYFSMNDYEKHDLSDFAHQVIIREFSNISTKKQNRNNSPLIIGGRVKFFN